MGSGRLAMGPVGTAFSRPRLSRNVETTDRVGGAVDGDEGLRTGSCMFPIQKIQDRVYGMTLDLRQRWRLVLSLPSCGCAEQPVCIDISANVDPSRLGGLLVGVLDPTMVYRGQAF